MVLEDVFDKFVADSPISVMARATLENVFAEDRLNAIFENNAQKQRDGELMFSTVADMMGSVVCRIRPSINAAYVAREECIGVTVKAVYDKLKGIESEVSRGLVRETAGHMAKIIEATKATLPELVPGYRVKIVDGNHLRRTDRRIKELRDIRSAPLPGKSLAVLDPRLMLIVDVLLCEDGHAQERSLFPQLAETIERNDLWIADRNFCTTKFLFAFFQRHAKFIIRQHAGNLRWELKGRRKRIGEIETGVVYEQAMQIFDEHDNVRVIRRITVHLYEPTRDGDTEIHILTNLPKKVGALRVANLYSDRWKIETAFQEMADNLEGEINTLGYPKAALFGFCMALVSYNVLSVVRAAIRAAHGREKEAKVSTYYMADEIAGTYRGMMIALGPEIWTEEFSALTPHQMAKALIRIAKQMKLSKYQKHKQTPKKNRKKKKPKPGKHVSTAKILATRKKEKRAA
jgi:hypothetical protein